MPPTQSQNNESDDGMPMERNCVFLNGAAAVYHAV